MTLVEAMEAIRSHGAGGARNAHELPALAERSRLLAGSSSLRELAELAEAFASARLRNSLRDMMPLVSKRLAEQSGDATALASVVRLLTATGQSSVFCNDLFQFCGERLQSLQGSDLATYLYQGGRHGPRCKHLMDAAIDHATQLAPQMAVPDIMRAWRGLLRFSKDRRAFFQAALPKVRSHVGSLNVPQLLVALRVARDLNGLNEFVDLHAACCNELMVKMESLSLNEAAQCLAASSYSPRFRAQAQGLVRCVEQKWSRTEDLSPLRVAEVVDALEAFASWGMKPQSLVQRLDAFLVEHEVELKNTGSVSLWVSAAQSLAKMDMFDAKWPFRAVEFARDPLLLEKASFVQQCGLAMALARLRIYDEAAYKNCADLAVANFSLFKEASDLASVLWAYASMGCFHKGLFDSAYDLMVSWMEGEKLDLANAPTQGAVIQAVWSFAVAGYHQRYESFAAFLDYALFTEVTSLRVPQLRRLAQLADAVLTEAPQLAKLCQYPERLEAARSHPRSRSVLSLDAPGDAELGRGLEATLQEMGWTYDAQLMPDAASAFSVDLALERQTGHKVGLLAPGRFELLAVGLPGEVHGPRESGLFALRRRLLRGRGWRTTAVARAAWEGLPGPLERRAFLESAVQRALQEPLPASLA